MIEPMLKLRVIALKRDVERATDALYSFGAVQVIRSKLDSYDVPTSSFAELSEALIELRSLEKLLNLQNGVIASGESKARLLERYRVFAPRAKEFKDALAERARLKAEVDSLRAKREAIAPFVPIDFRLNPDDALIDYLMLEAIDEKKLVELLEKKKTDHAIIKNGARSFVLVVCRKGANVDDFLKLSKRSLSIPAFSEKSYSLESRAIDDSEFAAEKKLREADEEISLFKSHYAQEIASLRKGLESHALLAELPNKFGATHDMDVIEGWVPSSKANALESELTKSLGKAFVLEKLAFKRSEQPVELKNPKFAQPYELFINFFSLPRSDEIDPTLIFSISFPILFGMILGDVGYGLIALLLALALRTRKGAFGQIGGIMLLSSIFTILFGLVFGEMFGLQQIGPITLHPLIERGGESLTPLMALVLVVGVIQITLGLILGVYSNWNANHKSHAYAKAGWLAFFLGVVAAAVAAVIAIPFVPIVAAIIALAGIVVIAKFEGATALLEIPGIMSNTLSYLRIMALGLSGVIIAKMVNSLPVGAMLDNVLKGGDIGTLAVSVLLFILVAAFFVIGHGLSFALAAFESFIHPMRLHYVEFFSKFYKGGGVAFVPLRDTEVK